MLKICQLCSVDFVVQMFLLPLIDGMQEAGWKVTSVCSDNGLTDDLRAKGYHVETVAIKRGLSPIAHLLAINRLVRLFRREQFDVVHVHTPVAAMIGRLSARIAKVPIVIYTAHGFYFHDEMSAIARSVFIGLEQVGGRWTDLLFTQSLEDAKVAVEKNIVPPDRVYAIGNGVSPQRFDPKLIGNQRELRQSLGIPVDSFLVGMICRLVREKGVAEFLEAAISVATLYPHTWFILIGERLESDHAGSVERDLRTAKEILGSRLVLTGLRHDVPALLGAMDLFCLPSWREGMPRTIIEAMMMAKPVIATNIRGAREEVIPEETGLLVPTRNPKALALAITRCVSKPMWAEALGAEGRKRALSLYDESKIVALQIDRIKEFMRPSTIPESIKKRSHKKLECFIKTKRTIIRQLFDWKPRHSMRQGLQITADWYRARHSASGIQYPESQQVNANRRCHVSVVVVNYNAGETLLKCVKHVQQQAEQVIVVDNASADGSIAALKNEFPAILVLCNKRNLGFATACNIGARVADGDHILFLNPDCIIEPSALSTLVRAVNSAPDVGMVGGLLTNPDGTEQVGGRRYIPTPWRSFVMAFGFNRLGNLYPELFSDLSMLNEPLPAHPVEVDAISGACMLVRRDALEDVGLLDEGYFMHCEDLDWCVRFRKKNWKILFVPNAQIVHFKGLCSNSRPIFVEWNKHKGMIRFYRKFFRDQYPTPFMFLVALGVWLRFSAITVFHTTKHIGRMLGLRN